MGHIPWGNTMDWLAWFPRSDKQKADRKARLENEWKIAVERHREGDARAEAQMLGVLRRGGTPSLSKAMDALHPPAPRALQWLLKKNPQLHPMGRDAATNRHGETLLHAWAQQPDAGDARHGGITTLLLTFPPTAQMHGWYQAELAFRQDKLGQDAQMLAARHGNWALLKGLVPYSRQATSVTRRDQERQHWVDHWVEGVLERLVQGTPLSLSAADPAFSAFQQSLFADNPQLLGRSDGVKGKPLSRLLAGGVDWRLAEHLFPSRPDANPESRSEVSLGSREGPVHPEHRQAYGSLTQALHPSAGVRGPGIDSYYLMGAMVTTQPLEALEWIMEGLSHYREDPSEKPRACHVWNGRSDLPEGVSSSPALPWLARPERLALALEKKWLEETTVMASRIPELPRLLLSLSRDPDQASLADRILAALEKNYPVQCREGNYRSLVREQALDSLLPAAQQARPGPRF